MSSSSSSSSSPVAIFKFFQSRLRGTRIDENGKKFIHLMMMSEDSLQFNIELYSSVKFMHLHSASKEDLVRIMILQDLYQHLTVRISQLASKVSSSHDRVVKFMKRFDKTASTDMLKSKFPYLIGYGSASRFDIAQAAVELDVDKEEDSNSSYVVQQIQSNSNKRKKELKAQRVESLHRPRKIKEQIDTVDAIIDDFMESDQKFKVPIQIKALTPASSKKTWIVFKMRNQIQKTKLNAKVIKINGNSFRPAKDSLEIEIPAGFIQQSKADNRDVDELPQFDAFSVVFKRNQLRHFDQHTNHFQTVQHNLKLNDGSLILVELKVNESEMLRMWRVEQIRPSLAGVSTEKAIIDDILSMTNVTDVPTNHLLKRKRNANKAAKTNSDKKRKFALNQQQYGSSSDDDDEEEQEANAYNYNTRNKTLGGFIVSNSEELDEDEYEGHKKKKSKHSSSKKKSVSSKAKSKKSSSKKSKSSKKKN
jgi:hypothetical protein